MEYDLSGTARSVDIIKKLINNTTGVPIVGLDTANPTADYFERLPPCRPRRSSTRTTSSVSTCRTTGSSASSSN
jgi:hypothetical protein